MLSYRHHGVKRDPDDGLVNAVSGGGAGVPAIAHSLPFDDPKKLKRTAVG